MTSRSKRTQRSPTYHDHIAPHAHERAHSLARRRTPLAFLATFYFGLRCVHLEMPEH